MSREPLFERTTPTREQYTPEDVDYSELNALQLSLLTEEQRELVETFVAKIKDDYPSNVRDLTQVVRFLMAKHWDLCKSESLWRKKFEWVESFKPHLITEGQVSAKCKMGRAVLYGRDKFGRPIIVIRACNSFPISATETTTYEEEEEATWMSFVYMAELASVNLPPPPYNQVVVISDRKHHNRRNMDMKTIKLLCRLGDYYPELLHRMYVLNANWIFSLCVKLAKAIVDSRTLDKLKLCGSTKELLQDIDQEHLLPDHHSDICSEAGHSTDNITWLPRCVPAPLVLGSKRLNPKNIGTDPDLWIDMDSK